MNFINIVSVEEKIENLLRCSIPTTDGEVKSMNHP